MSAKLALLTATTLASFVLGSVPAPAALPDRPTMEGAGRRGAAVYGLIDSIDGDTLVLATPIGAVTVLTDANTRFRIPDVEAPDINDLAVGDSVAAGGWWEQGSGTFRAFGVARLASDRTFPLSGELTDVNDRVLTVETPHGSATVRAGDDTVYRVRGVEDPGPDDLTAGMKVIVKGTLNTDGTLLAQVVAVLWVGPRPARLRGEVLAVDGDTFTIRTARRREITILTDEETDFRVPDVENPSIDDLGAGDRVACTGTVEDDGAARATLVVVLPDEVARLTGQVAAIEGRTLVLDTAGGRVGVTTDGDTLFRIPGVEEPGLDDIDVGDRVVAVGTWTGESRFHAVGVGVMGGRRPGQPGFARGRVVSVADDTLVVGTQRGPVTVLVDHETQFRVPGVDDPGLDDIDEGVLVGARGTWNEDGTLEASGVAALRGRWRRPGAREQ